MSKTGSALVYDRGSKLATRSSFHQRKSLLAPVANAAIHRHHIGVAHLLQIVCCERGTETAAAIENHLRVYFRYARFNVAFDDPLAQVNRTRQVILGELAFFAHVDEQEFTAAAHSCFYFVDSRFAHASLRIVNDFQKARRMLVSHVSSFRVSDNILPRAAGMCIVPSDSILIRPSSANMNA